jgi:uncharacterized protein (TIGR02145 family)
MKNYFNFKSVFLLALFLLIVFSCKKDEIEEDAFAGETGTFTDSRDGNTYKWVKIGDQVWMAENLAYLPEVSPPSEYSDTEPCYYVYGYEGTNVSEAKTTYNYKTYGVLYNYLAALTACPNGWHIPTIEEKHQLVNYLKVKGYNYDMCDFLNLLGGWRCGNEWGMFEHIGHQGYWWGLGVCYDDEDPLPPCCGGESSESIRCIKD